MSNYENNANLRVLHVEHINGKTLIDLFSNDSDFTENTEYFREDTLTLGFENEAERCSVEIYDEIWKTHENEADLEILEAMIDKAWGYRGYLIGNSSYCGDYTHEITQIGESGDSYIISIAYVG